MIRSFSLGSVVYGFNSSIRNHQFEPEYYVFDAEIVESTEQEYVPPQSVYACYDEQTVIDNNYSILVC